MLKKLLAAVALLLTGFTAAAAAGNLTMANAAVGTSPQQIAADAFVAALAPLEPEWKKRFGAALLKRIRDTR
jgi:TRAP-type C4-dicarboxylate transport system substrate-binding protein